jgi:hypothetical protein
MPETSDGGKMPFLLGTEVAHARRIDQPGFDGQMSLLGQETALKRKVITAVIVIMSVFVAGLILGAVAGIFI